MFLNSLYFSPFFLSVLHSGYYHLDYLIHKFFFSFVSNVFVCLPVQEMRVRPLSREDPLEEGVATHSSILAWRIPWTEEPGGQQSMGSQRVGHD